MNEAKLIRQELISFRSAIAAEPSLPSSVIILQLLTLFLPLISTILGSPFAFYTPLGFIIISIIRFPSRFYPIIKDGFCFLGLSIIFGQKLFPKNLVEIIIWALFCGCVLNSYSKRLAVTSTVVGLLVSSPVLVLDWMRWWQVWPNPANIGISMAQAGIMLLVAFRK